MKKREIDQLELPKESLFKQMQKDKILLSILLIGAILRFWNIGWGLPELYEEATPLVKSWNMWNWGQHGLDFNPHFFNYPALTFYLQFILQALQYFVGNILRIYPSLDSFGKELSSIVIPARLLMATFDVGTIIVVYLLGIEAANRRVGLIAAAFVAINSLHIQQAHYITVDTPLTFFVTLALLFIYRSSASPTRANYLRAGVCIGLAAATKYTGAFLIPVFIGVQLLRARNLRGAFRSLTSLDLIAAIALACVVFCITNPYIFLSPDEFKRDFSFEQTHVAEGHLGLDSSESTIGYYVGHVLPDYLGRPLTILAEASIALFFFRKEKKWLQLLLFPLVYVGLISTWQMRAERYLLPVIPMLMIVAALGLVVFWNNLTGYLKRFPIVQQIKEQSFNAAAAALVGALLLIPPLLHDYDFQRSIVLPNTNTVAKEWIMKHVQPGAVIATGPFGMQLPDTLYKVFDIPFLGFDAERISAFYDTRWYEDCDLLIASDYDYARYAKEPAKYAEFLPYYDSLRTQWHLAYEVKPGEHQLGPTLWIYTPPALEHQRFDSTLFQKFETVPESSRVSTFLRDLTIILIQKQKLEKAEQVLQSIVSVEITNLEARFTYARVLFTLKRYNEALVEIERSVRLNPDIPDFYALGGNILLRLGRDKEAEMSLLKALQLNNSDTGVYEDLIIFYTNRNEKDKLIDILSKYHAILPQGSGRATEIAERLRQLKAGS